MKLSAELYFLFSIFLFLLFAHQYLIPTPPFSGKITNIRVCGEVGAAGRFCFVEFEQDETVIKAITHDGCSVWIFSKFYDFVTLLLVPMPCRQGGYSCSAQG